MRQLLIHRHNLVWLRVQVKNELQHLAMNRAMQKKGRLWSVAGQQALRELELRPWAGRRWEDLLELLAMLNGQVEGVDLAVEAAAEKNEQARLRMSPPGLGPVTSLAFEKVLREHARVN